MGRDLLEQDYILKQITASLIYPEKQLGKTFWDKVYAKAQQKYGTTQVPVNTFNKVWIMADRAEVFEHNQTAFVVDQPFKGHAGRGLFGITKTSSDIRGLSPTKSEASSNSILRSLKSSVKSSFPNSKKKSTPAKISPICVKFLIPLFFPAGIRKISKQALLNQVYADQPRSKASI